MAFAFSAHGQTNYGNMGCSASFALNAGVKLLVCFVAINSTLGRNGGAPTYNGVAMTQFDQRRVGSPNGESMLDAYYLLNPDTGAGHTLSVPDTNWQFIQGFYSSYTATGTVAFDKATGVGTAGNNPACAITPTGVRSLIVGGIIHGSNAWSPTAYSGTNIANQQQGLWAWGHQYKLHNGATEWITSWDQTDTPDPEDYGISVGVFSETSVLIEQAVGGSLGLTGSLTVIPMHAMPPDPEPIQVPWNYVPGRTALCYCPREES